MICQSVPYLPVCAYLSVCPCLPLSHELGCEYRVHCYVQHAVCSFYWCLVELDDASMYWGVLRQNIEDALYTQSFARN